MRAAAVIVSTALIGGAIGYLMGLTTGLRARP
jgi:ABC-type antimicrobial peptide transport system permease subunit